MNLTALNTGTLIQGDPKRTAIVPLTQRRSGNDSCVLLKLGTSPGLVSNKEVVQNGFGPCWSPFHGNDDDIFYSSSIAAQVCCYPTLRKASFTQYDDLGHFRETN